MASNGTGSGIDNGNSTSSSCNNTSNSIYIHSTPGRIAYSLPALDVREQSLDMLLGTSSLRQGPIGLPEVSELDVVRHLTRLGHMDFSVDSHFYPLGSCTMKYNPRVHERIVLFPGLSNIHPYQQDWNVRGTLQLMRELQDYLAQISGLDAVTLQPLAGSQGELAGVMVIDAYFSQKNEPQRRKILLPDSAHGTNPATAALYGYEVVTVKSDSHGNVDLEDLASKCDVKTAALMLTNPNTLGLFDKGLNDIERIVHGAGALLYGDGANMNALVGRIRPGKWFDILHFNLHKTFSVPHGGGGPGAGPIAVRKFLERYLPVPRVQVSPYGDFPILHETGDELLSIGKLSAFNGAIGAIVRAYAYIRALGAEGMRSIADHAVLNANYLRVKLQEQGWNVYIDRPCMHEVVISAVDLGKDAANHVAKALLDYGIHSPTVYFPLIVPEALMIEPTESESLQTLDHFLVAMGKIRISLLANELAFHNSPTSTPVGPIDQIAANRKPVTTLP